MSHLTVGLVVKLVAKSGHENEVAEFLAGALPAAQAEHGTPIWLAVRTDQSTFWIVDAHPDDAARQAHLEGEIAAALMANAERLLAEPPQIMKSTVLAAKPTG